VSRLGVWSQPASKGGRASSRTFDRRRLKMRALEDEYPASDWEALAKHQVWGGHNRTRPALRDLEVHTSPEADCSDADAESP